jgi:subtilisin family serine protease
MNLRHCAAIFTLLTAVATIGATTALQTAGAAATPRLTSSEPAASGTFAPGRVLVRFRSDTSRAARSQVVRSVGATTAGAIPDLGVEVLRVPDGAEQRVVAALERSGKVSFAERDGVVNALDVTPNDPYWPNQWGPAKVNAPAAWSSTTGATSTVVAVLDTGVTYSQPDMQGRFVAGYDFINNDNDPTDDNGHGTETAGIVGAASDNATGIAGMCWTCAIMPVKVLDSTAYGSWSAVSSGITWATDHGAKVISMSLAGSSGGTTLQNAVSYALVHDVVVVAAGGNNGNTSPMFPAYYSGVLSVAGTQSNDTLYPWSTYGSWVDVAAPGCDASTTKSGGYTSSFCGTSAATPVVAGVAGLARSLNPSATTAQIVSAIESSAVNIGSVIAYGRVDAGAALATLGGTAPAATTSPAASPSPASTTSATFSGSLTAKITSRSYSLASGAGTVQLSLTFSKASSLNLTVTNATGQVLLQTSGASPLQASASVSAGAYSVTVSGSGRASFTLVATAPAP